MFIYIYIYIYIYILPVKNIWPPSKIVISHPKSVIFKETSCTTEYFYSLYEQLVFRSHIKYK